MAARKIEKVMQGQDGGDNLSPQEYAAQNPIGGGGIVSTGTTGVSENYIPKAREEYPQTEGRTKAGIITADGQYKPYYNLSTEPGEILGSFDDVKRKRVLNILYSRGWYGNQKPGGGVSDSDKEAVRNLLYYSNLQGVDYQTVLSTVERAPIWEPSSRAAQQVASSQDLIEIANRSALSTIGRKLTETEAQQFAAAYQGVQRSSAGATQAAPSADVYFQNRIEKKYGAESQSYKYLNAISNMSQLLENL